MQTCAGMHVDPPLRCAAAVPLQARLRSCALVCRTWAAAAAAATTTLDMQLRDQAHADSLSKWLGTHGCNIEHLAVCFDEQYHAPQVCSQVWLHPAAMHAAAQSVGAAGILQQCRHLPS